ncbi:hypothetical protein E2C01_050395 [Portunus trituberculatus]|uniref:Uncharacterized protein n=1 Tax=Portunus trituberculatus TaxID=210409 RepID=A0A5B7GIU0_PORTR|nr:hypothetical protein [Portunus trituberculatus]
MRSPQHTIFLIYDEKFNIIYALNTTIFLRYE